MRRTRSRSVGSTGKVSKKKFLSLLFLLGIIVCSIMSMFWLNVPKNYHDIKSMKKSLLDSDRKNYIPNAVEQGVGDINATRKRAFKPAPPSYSDTDRRYLESVLYRK